MQPALRVGDQVGIGLEIQHVQGTPVQTSGIGRDAGIAPRAAQFGQRGPDDGAAIGDAAQPLGLLGGAAGHQQRAGDHGRIGGEGDRCDVVAQRLRHHAGIERSHADATVRRWNQQRRHAQFRQPGNQIAGPSLVTAGKAAHPLERRALAQIVVQRVAQQRLFGGQSEFHQASPARGSRGMPSPRSLMMFFWIWLVPPPMIRPR